MTTTQHLNLTLLNSYLETLDVSVLQQMLSLYQQQSSIYLAAISTAQEQCHQPAWQEQCHKMKGAAASAGLSQVQQQLISMERSSADWPTKLTQLQQLKQLNLDAIQAFKQWLVTN
ncbi:Hpt domain-containing protein [Colwellia chukchiensis]|uniref:Hpt domain-containing protein n=1 Tax=Colwellia chukchiensis TaxID=641665 RepID=A0A1H7LIV9_9GAMM|nr:Hpt domain-containing protein [Colwellia chukchiensis]SEK98932.1 Hpt domain-containing protein [Colwellia chukchiensis]